MTQSNSFRGHEPSGGRSLEKHGVPDDGSQWTAQSESRLKETLEQKILLAHFVLVVDRVWPLLWGPIFVIGAFVLVSLLGLWPLLPQQAHQGLLAAFGLAFALSIIPLARFKKPTRAEALRRLETEAGLKHRPASTYEDSLAPELDTPETRQLWAIHRARMARLFGRLRVGWPHPRVDRFDPLALRAALMLMLVASFAAYGKGSWERVAAAFDLRSASGGQGARVDAWITPPVYTAKPPLMLIDASQPTNAGRAGDGAIEAPEKSELTIRVNDTRAQDYRLRILTRDGDGEKIIAPVAPAGTEGNQASGNGGANTAEMKAQISSGLVAELNLGGSVVANWRIRIVPDRAPSISWAEPLALMQRGSLRYHYKMDDDYGVVAAQAVIERAKVQPPQGHSPVNAPAPRTGGEAIVVPLSLPRANLKSGEGQTYKDLTSHPWAGLPVTVTLTVRDQAGQTGKSEPVSFVLPERQFTKPLARAIIEQRRTLVERPDMRDAVAKALDALTLAPETYVPDKTVYLALRSAYWRLIGGREPDVESSVVDQLWHVALRIEDGDLSSAERDLRAAQDKLMRALEENASPEEIKRLMDELRMALNHFLESAIRNSQNRDDFGPQQQGAEQVTSKELNDILSKIEMLAKTGSKDAARQMLSQLRDMLENVETGAQQRSSQSEQMMNALDGLSELITKQQKLLDETFRAQQRQEDTFQENSRQSSMQGQQGGPERDPLGMEGSQRGGAQSSRRGHSDRSRQHDGGGAFGALGKEQMGISEELERLMEEVQGLGAPPSSQFKDAQRAMGDAGKALERENGSQAVEQETLALEKLRKGTQSLAEQMMEGGKSQGGRMGRMARDPLGRPQRSQGADPGDSVKVPGEIDVQRAREILDELRNRLGEPSRPAQELDYIERLIRRF